jgi:integrase
MPHWPSRTKPLPIAEIALHSQASGVTLTLKAGPKSSTVVRKLAPGIYTYGPDGYRFFKRIARKLHSVVFRPPHLLPLTELREAYRQWRVTLTAEGEPHPAAAGTFAEDVDTYLSRVTAMPSYQTRKHQLGEWVKALGGDRPRSSITATDIDRVLQDWLKDGYAIQTVKLRRTDLIQVWAKLDGKRAPNPARDTTLPANPPLEPRGMLLEHVQAAFAAMPDSLTKLRLWVMVTTGLPQKQIKELSPADVDLEHRRIRTRARRKGAGAVGGWRPITPAAVEALRALSEAKALGRTFNNSSLQRVWGRACKRAGIPGKWRPYDLRHTFGTWIYAATGDLSSTADLLGHAKLATAERYTLGARMAVARRATDLVSIPLGMGAKVTAPPVTKVSRKFLGRENNQ